jgi:hypothetical protein
VVEHFLGKEEVVSSILLNGSKIFESLEEFDRASRPGREGCEFPACVTQSGWDSPQRLRNKNLMTIYKQTNILVKLTIKNDNDV